MAVDDVSRVCPSDVVVLVMGLTGVWKSTFIEKLTGEDAEIGHSLVSATTGLALYPFMSGSRRVFFLDTPAFNDTHFSDTKIFQEIAFWLSQIYVRRAHLGGSEGARFTILVTTMWDEIYNEGIDYDKASQREDELMATEKYWGSIENKGCCTQRWNGTRGSALSILTALLHISDNQGPVLWQIQKELVDEKRDLDDTTAGLELTKHHGAAWQQIQKELKSLRASHEQALQIRDSTSAQCLQSQKEELERQLAIAETAERDLRDDLEMIFKAKTEEYQKLFFSAQEEIAELSHQVEDLEAESRALKRRMDEDAEAFGEAERLYEKERAAIKAAAECRRPDKLEEERAAIQSAAERRRLDKLAEE
ncbi:Fc.00g106910.m01.CDS01 [Cosmosporella sp. VM-42]